MKFYCPKCGTQSKSGEKFCASCGNNLEAIKESTSKNQQIPEININSGNGRIIIPTQAGMQYREYAPTTNSNIDPTQSTNPTVNAVPKEEKVNPTSLVLGIIAITSVVFFIISLPMSIIGLVLACQLKKSALKTVS